LNSASKDGFKRVNLDWRFLVGKPYVASVAEFSFADFEVQLLIKRIAYIK